jgi:glutamate synthase domain-containing protein 3
MWKCCSVVCAGDSKNPGSDVMEIDCRDLSVREINRMLKEAVRNGERKIVLKNPGAKHYIAAGLVGEVEVEIKGSVGFFVATMAHQPRIIVEKNAGWFAGDNMTNGYLEIRGNAGDGVGQGIYGGVIVVRGDAGARTGEIMKNGTIIIGGDSDFMTGLYMMGGRMVVLGNLRSMAGESIVRGVIYVKGEVESLGKNAKIVEIDEKDEEWLKDVLKKYNFNSSTSSFRKIIPIRKRFVYGSAPSEEG